MRLGQTQSAPRLWAARARLERDVGADVFAVNQVTNADHASFFNRRVLDERFFHFLRADVRAVVNDDLFCDLET